MWKEIVLMLHFAAIVESKFWSEADLENIVAEIVINGRKYQKISSLKFINKYAKGDHNETNDFTDNLLQLIGKRLPYEFVDLQALERVKRQPNGIVIILADSLVSFSETLKKLSPRRFSYGAYYLAIIKTASNQDLQLMFRSLWDLYIHNVNIISQRNGESFSVNTFIPFSPLGCNKTDPVHVAEFTKGQFTFKPQTFFPNKFQNFHNCPLKITTFKALAPSVLIEDYENGTYRLYGRDISILEALESSANFKSDRQHLSKYGGELINTA